MTPLPLVAVLAQPCDGCVPAAIHHGQLAVAASAPSEKPDTTYGRIDGDMSVVAGVGATVAPRGVRGALELRARYLDTVGAYVVYEDAAAVGTTSDPRRVLGLGFELRPLFLARWLRDDEIGTARVDLAIDSLGFEIGTYFAQPIGASFGAHPGLQLGVGIELPVLAHASGPWIGVHGGVRWSDTTLGGDDVRGPSDRAAFLSITLTWHQFFGAHAVDVGDRSVSAR